MPRPKVLPENRRRSSRACQPCRAAKKKCNAGLPCSQCIQRNIHSLCTFNETNGKFYRRRGGSSLPAVNGSFEHQRELHPAGFTPTYPSASDTISTTASSDPQSKISTSREPDTEPTALMLQNSDGERVFVGSHGSLAFLHLLRKIVSKRIGVSDFSHNVDCDIMLEAELVSGWQCDVQDFLSQYENLEEIWISSFLAATNGLIDVVDRDEAIELIHTPDVDLEDTRPLRYAVKMMIIAIGIQCSGNEGLPSLQDQIFFTRARQASFTSFLEHSCPDMVRVFLLMSFYLLGACRRNTATMYLGVAAQSAHILGLHNPESHRFVSPGPTKELFRLWKSLASLDMIVNSILARPLLISPSEWKISRILSVGNALEGSTNPLDAAYSLSLIIRKDTAELFDKKTPSVDSVEDHLKNLKEWSTSLPGELQLSSMPECPETEAQLRVIGSLHISCFYYFSVIIITRPFLIPCLVSRLEDRQLLPGHNPEEATSKEANLAHTCLNSAIYMIQTCSEVMDNGLLLGNMCIMKAWIFSAALVVGLQLFASIEPDVEAEDVFSKSRAILQALAKASPQAAQYLEILNFLDSAIKRQHQPRTPQRQLNADLLLNRIMRLDTNLPVPFVNDLDVEGFPPTASQLEPSNSSVTGIDVTQDVQELGDCLDFNWDEDIGRFWDFLPTEGSQSYEPHRVNG